MNITTTYTTTPAGAGRIVAKGAGRQRTLPYDQTKSMEWNFGAGVGALLAVLATPEQKAKMLHPTAKGRIRIFQPNPNKASFRWTINV